MLFGVVLLLAGSAVPSVATAATTCTSGAAIECPEIAVPLDHAGRVTGELRLYAERLGDDRRRPDALIYLAGGPGQAATPDFPQFGSILSPVLGRMDIITFDQRGTGRSGKVSCRSLDGTIDARAVSGCWTELGRSAPFFTTAESVGDLSTVLDSLGVARATLFGVSYGTRLALDFAAAHPTRVARLILDSPVLPEGRDAFARSTMASAAPVLGEVCAHGRCSRVTSDPVNDLRQLMARLEGRSLTGRYVTPRGRVVRRAITSGDILDATVALDFDPQGRVAIPGVMRAAVDGDTSPLVRFVLDTLRRVTGPSRDGQDSAAVNIATTCNETALPWDPAASAAKRLVAAAAAASSLGDDPFAPFNAAAAASGFVLRACAGWPATSAGQSPVVLPNVPALILSGRADMRTPTVDAKSIAARLPRSRLLVMPGVGHSVLGTDVSGCARRAVLRFLRGASVGGCARQSRRWSTVAPPPPRTLADFPGSTRVRRAAAAAAVTISDALSRGLTLIPESARPGAPASAGGLRGGWIRRVGPRIELHAVRYTSDVSVTGTIDLSSPRSRVVVRGPDRLAGVARIERRSGRLALRVGASRVVAPVPGGIRVIRG